MLPLPPAHGPTRSPRTANPRTAPCSSLAAALVAEWLFSRGSGGHLGLREGCAGVRGPLREPVSGAGVFRSSRGFGCRCPAVCGFDHGRRVDDGGVTGWQRVLWWVLAVVGAGAAVASVVWGIGDELEKADQVASVVGAIAGVAALALSLYQVTRPSPPGPQPGTGTPSPPAPAPTGPVTAGDRSIVAGRDVIGSSTGDHGPAGSAGPGVQASPPSPAPSPPPASPPPPAGPTTAGNRSIVAGRDVRNSSTGDGPTPGTP